MEIKELRSQINDIIIDFYGYDFKAEKVAYKISRLVEEFIDKEKLGTW